MATKKWSWSQDMVECLIKSLKEYKRTCEFNAVDFNSDKVQLYEGIRKAMARINDETDFSPMNAFTPNKTIKDMTKDEYKVYKEMLDKHKSLTKLGYNRIKEKLKSIRQDYSKAVVSGTRSGSGKVVLQYFDDLASIWGGSPATEPLPFGVESASTTNSSDSSNVDDIEEATTPSSPSSIQDDVENIEDSHESSGNEKKGKRKATTVSNAPKLIDNKRKHLEKRLTSAQRDQKLLESAREDTLMRKEMMDSFKESSRSTAIAIQNMSETMKGLAQGLTQSIAILANALQPHMYSSQCGQNYNQQFNASPSYYSANMQRRSGATTFATQSADTECNVLENEDSYTFSYKKCTSTFIKTVLVMIV